MRKFLVKHFVLDYSISLFGRKYHAVRASRIIAPLFMITGILVSFFTPDWPTPTLMLWFLYLLDLIALFFGFVYFRIKPAKWEELDKNQKKQAGHFLTLTPEQMEEWNNLI